MADINVKKVTAKEVASSRGRMTVEAALLTEAGVFSASVPSGVSKGEFEAKELPAKQAVKNIEKVIGPAFFGFPLGRQAKADRLLQKLDGTKDKHKLGANALLAVSLAYARASSFWAGIFLWQYIANLVKTKPSLPTPFLLLIEGGKHGRGKLLMQEFMFAVLGENFSFKEKFEKSVAVYKKIGELLVEKDLESGLKLGLEGAFTPEVSESEALEIIRQAMERVDSGSGEGGQAGIAIDAAGSSFKREDGKYFLQGKTMTTEGLAEFYSQMAEKFPIFSLEDPFSQNDLAAWKDFNRLINKTRKMNQRGFMVVGDDLTTTNIARMKMAHKEKLCNSMIVKPNQIGTLTETLKAALLARKFGWKLVVSHRAGETNDSFIADLAVGLGAEFIKTGSPSQASRMAKYNRLFAIEKEIC